MKSIQAINGPEGGSLTTVDSGIRSSIIYPLSLLFGVLLVLSAIVAGFLVSIVSNPAPFLETQAAIDAELRGLSKSERSGGIREVLLAVESSIARKSNTFFYSVRNPLGTPLTGNLKPWATDQLKEVDGLPLVEVPHADVLMPTMSTRLFTDHYDVMVKSTRYSTGHEVFVGRNVDDLQAATWLATTLGWAIIGIMVLILLYIFVVSVYVVTGVRRISIMANTIRTTGDLSVRIPLETSWGDLGDLAANWNFMLDKIQSLVLQMQQTSNSIAHDLRTPLTSLRMELDNVSDKTLRDSLVADTDKLLAMISGVLRIVEIETKTKRSGFRRVSVHDIVDDVVSLYGPLIEDKSIELKQEIAEVEHLGDRDLLFQALMNIFDNAVKFTPDGGRISIVLRQSEHVIIKICDSGPGVPVGEQEQIFQRFYRTDSSRKTPGYGLGLSVVVAVAELHEAKIELHDNQPGLCFSILFPTLDAD